jgi:hypothetical protein
VRVTNGSCYACATLRLPHALNERRRGAQKITLFFYTFPHGRISQTRASSSIPYCIRECVHDPLGHLKDRAFKSFVLRNMLCAKKVEKIYVPNLVIRSAAYNAVLRHGAQCPHNISPPALGHPTYCARLYEIFTDFRPLKFNFWPISFQIQISGSPFTVGVLLKLGCWIVGNLDFGSTR